MRQADSATPIQDDPVVLLVGGTPRSGTTALADILNMHEDVALLSEYALADFIEHLDPLFAHEERVAGINARYEANPAPAEDASPIYPVMRNEPDEPRRFPRRRDLQAIVAGALAAALGKKAPRVIGAKSPLYMLDRRNDRLEAIFPRVRHLLILRNPLDQINSSINRRNRARRGIDEWHVHTVEDAIGEYRAVLRAAILLALRRPDAVFVARFETLVRRQAQVLAEIQAFLGVRTHPLPQRLSENRDVVCLLTDQERSLVTAALGHVMDAWERVDFTGPAPAVLPVLSQLLEKMPFRQDVDDLAQVVGWGWSDREADGIWTDGDRATLVLGPCDPAAGRIVLTVTPLLPRATGSLRCAVSINGEVAFDGAWRADGTGAEDLVFAEGFRRYELALEGPFRAAACNIVTFSFAGVTTPRTEGINQDDRRLAMKLHTLRLEPRRGPGAPTVRPV